MVIAGLIVLFFIAGMFLQAITASPRPDPEWQIDTDSEIPSTAAPDEESDAVAA